MVYGQVNHPACPKWTPFRASAKLQAQLHHAFPTTFAPLHHETAPAETTTMPFGSAVVGVSRIDRIQVDTNTMSTRQYPDSNKSF